MRHNSKAKLAIYAETPLQQAVAVIGSGTSAAPLEKRKEDADKPLYIKRVWAPKSFLYRNRPF